MLLDIFQERLLSGKITTPAWDFHLLHMLVAHKTWFNIDEALKT